MFLFPKFEPLKVTENNSSSANAANLAKSPFADHKISGIRQVSHTVQPFVRSQLFSSTEIMNIPLRPCVWCKHYSFSSRHCQHYSRKLPEPTRECRCIHFWRRRPAARAENASPLELL